ncbi:MAG: class I SAM-dependent methyltransferase [Bacteroidales bacterium]|nr:class I SAM-dependent methyltransferase [Bacteroidales bacterium]
MPAFEKNKSSLKLEATEYPDFIAKFYDLIYHQVRDGVDNQFYLDRIKETKGRVLEAGSGTGRLFIRALESGADIYGIDISPSMLDILKSKLRKKDQHRVSLRSITDFQFDQPFELIVAPFRVFMHLLTKEDQTKALKNVRRHLNSGGKFIFDVFVPDLNYLIKGIDNVTDFEGEYKPGRKIKRIVNTTPDLINQTIDITFRYEWEDDDSLICKEWKSMLRFFFRYELEHLVERAGFSEFSILGDFEGHLLGKDSKEFIMVCKKN